MSEWILPLAKPAYNSVVENNKTVEARVPDPTKPNKQYWRIQPGDTLIFQAIDLQTSKYLDLPEVRFPVTYQRKYDTVKEMLETEGLQRTLPRAKSIQEATDIYLGFPGYRERITKNGIVAIGLGKRLS